MTSFKINSVIFSMLVLLSASGFAQQTTLAKEELFGTWRLSKMIYEGHELDLPNPDLRLTFQFFQNFSLRIYWDRKDPSVFCESVSNWTLQTDESGKPQLAVETFAVNPMNAFDCSGDPDMTLGKKESVPLWIQDGSLMMTLRLGDQDLTYLFNKQEKGTL